MVDTLGSVGEEKHLKADENGAITMNPSEPVAHTPKGAAQSESNQEEKLPSPAPGVPQIVIMNHAGDSFSFGDSFNPKDTCSSTKKKKPKNSKKGRRKDQDMRASVLAEGQQDEMARAEAAAVSSEQYLSECGWTELSLARASKAVDKHIAMERADISPSYTSDEWEAESANSDTDDDHTDSSDDDDPKSQVDRLIERGTLMYVDGENSALSSEEESDERDDSDGYDSESDITDVSPLGSPTASPLGLSPVLPRRTIPTSPLALHDNRDLSYCCDGRQSPFTWDNASPPYYTMDPRVNEGSGHRNHDSHNMDLLLQAVIELENKNNSDKYNLNHNSKNSGLPTQMNDPVFIHPIRDNPHHLHLRKNYQRRKNMSFSNEEVRKIDRDNKILLKKIVAAHTRKSHLDAPPHPSSVPRAQKPSNSAINRRKAEDKIRRENILLLKKIQEVKPTKPVVDSRVSSIGGVDPILTSVGMTNPNIRSASSSCGAFMRSISKSSHVSVPPPRKETAL